VTNADVAYAGGNVRLEAGMVTNCVLTGASDTIQDGKGLNLYIGGGIAVDSLLTSPLVLSGTCGAGAYIAGGVVSRCIIEKAAKNSSTWPAIGSGAYMKGGVLENCLLCGNSCEKGAIYLDDASAKAVNCSVIGNVVVNNKVGGIYVNNASATVVNCVVYGNGGTANNEWANKNDTRTRFFNCAFAESAAFTGANSTVTNLTDAAFKDFANGDYRPKREGALVNSGTNDLYSSYATSATDLGGAPRIQGKIIDIGCWEAAAGIGLQIIVR
jgi:parallel beta-helix repeat protein